MKQNELAEIGGIGRTTQIGYETGVTEPTTAYLRKIQPASIDIPFVLFGSTLQELQDRAMQGGGIDWPLMQSCHEDVEFFCMRFAPNCPQSYRWKMVAEVYEVICSNKRRPSTAADASRSQKPLEVIQGLWKSYDTNAV